MATNNSANYSPTQYAVQVGGANGGLTSLSVGSSGQVLTSAGAGVNPSFTTVSSGNFTLISTTTASNQATLNITTGLSSSYKMMKIIVTGLQLVTAGGNALWLRCSTNGGSTYDSANNYSYNQQFYGSDSNQDWNRSSADSHILLMSPYPDNSTATNSGSLELDIFNIASSSLFTTFRGISTANEVAVNSMHNSSGSYNVTGVNGIQFLGATGNIFVGNFYLYGIT